MPLVYIILGLAFVGFALWLVNNKVPMDSNIKTAINWIVLVLVIYWVLSVIGVLPALLSIRV